MTPNGRNGKVTFIYSDGDKMENTVKTSRKFYLDILKVMAIFLVLFTHTGLNGNKLYTVTTKGMLQTVYTMLDCFRTINNPLLFMISGALLLRITERSCENTVLVSL